ncbi:MAG: YitT family protein [Rikenellaceae bacterium]|nr:YitT family protein [Rikenellaceae bacterium]
MDSSQNIFVSEFKSYLIITVGLFLYSFAWTAVIIPANLVGGGAIGLASVIYYATGIIPVGVLFFIINAILVTVASILIGFHFGAKTIYGIIGISIIMSLLQELIPDPGFLGLTDDKLLSAILGGAISGTGVAMCFTRGGSTGGSDIVAMIVNKYRNISFGRIIMVCDTVIILSSYIVFREISVIIYGFILVAVYSYTIDYVMAGNKQSSQIFIISKHYDKIADQVISQLGRGVTVFEGKGWYTKNPQKVLMILCRRSETSTIYKIIKEYDHNAFISVGSVSSVYGEGFEILRTK